MSLLIVSSLTFVAVTINAATTVLAWRSRLRADEEHMQVHLRHAVLHDEEIETIEMLHKASHVHLRGHEMPVVNS